MSLSIDSHYISLLSGRLRNFKDKGRHLFNLSCPFCGDSQTKKTKARGYFFPKGNRMVYKCHNCQIGVGIANFIKKLDETLYREYLFESYKSGSTGFLGEPNKPSIPMTMKQPVFAKRTVFDHAEWCDTLPENHFCMTYLKARKITEITPGVLGQLLFTPTYKQFIDALIPENGKKLLDDARLVLLFYGKNNELVGVTGRSLETAEKTLRYITLRANDSTNKLIFGMNRINKNNPIKIVEGPIDSLFLFNTVASCDANLASVAKELISLGIPKENITLVFDREPRSRELVKLIGKSISAGYQVCLMPDTMVGKDVNDYIMNGITPKNLEEIIETNTVSGLKAKMEFTNWKKIND